MTERDTGNRNELTAQEAGAVLGLAAPAVLALADAGFLAASRPAGGGEPLFQMADIKAFQARNADDGSGYLALPGGEAADPQELLAALDGESEDMARRAFEIFAQVFPEAAAWTGREKQRFVEQAKARFEAILAVTGSGAEVDEALVGDLQDVGAEAAWSDAPLPQLLVILRISRDLVVQTAVELAEARGGHWALALSLLLTRILPAVDRLTDSLAQGYWAAMIGREEDARARYQHVVESSSDGVYEVDPEGRLTYANPSLELILGRSFVEMAGRHLDEVLQPVGADAGLDGLLGEPRWMRIEVARPDGVRRILDLHSVPRSADGEVVGHQGVVRDVTAVANLERDKNEFLTLVTYDLRQPLTSVLGLSATIESHADELPREQVRRLANQVRRQAERMARMADDLHDVSRLQSQTLLLSPRSVELLSAVEAALVIAGDRGEVAVDVPAGLSVMADARRLEQLLANLVENALVHGGSPVEVRLLPERDHAGRLIVAVSDGGPGVPDALLGTLFSGVRTLSRTTRDRSRGTGLGLSLVSGLAEAMGGRVWYDKRSGTSTFFVALSAAPGSR